MSSEEAENTWVWKSDEADLWFDPGTVVNIRVEQEKWQDKASGTYAADGDSSAKSAAYSLTASMAEGGLGGLHWW